MLRERRKRSLGRQLQQPRLSQAKSWKTTTTTTWKSHLYGRCKQSIVGWKTTIAATKKTAWKVASQPFRESDRVFVSSRRGDTWKKSLQLESEDVWCTATDSSLANKPYRPAAFHVSKFKPTKRGTLFHLAVSEEVWVCSNGEWTNEKDTPARTSFPVFVRRGVSILI